MFVFIFSATSVQIFSHSNKNLARYVKNVKNYSCKVSVILVRVSRNLNFLDRFSKKSQISNIIKLRPVGAELFHMNRRTDMTEAPKTDDCV